MLNFVFVMIGGRINYYSVVSD